MVRTKTRMRLCTALLLCSLAFIWGNSLLPGAVSGAISDGVKQLLEAILPGTGGESTDGFLVRKLAHFTEFAVLGACLGWLFSMLQRGLFQPLLWGVTAACIDETIQMFVPDRGPAIRDVLIDSSGVLAGILLLHLGHALLVNTRKHFGG